MLDVGRIERLMCELQFSMREHGAAPKIGDGHFGLEIFEMRLKQKVEDP